MPKSRKSSRKKASLRVIGESMASQTKASKIEKLTALPGVGAATAKKLVDAKLDTVSKVASAGATKLIKAGLSAVVEDDNGEDVELQLSDRQIVNGHSKVNTGVDITASATNEDDCDACTI